MSRERRSPFVGEGDEAEPGHFGCPMLMRSRFFFPSNPDHPAMRCALGWALRTKLDVARCIATDAVTDCWKVHPERTPEVAVDEPLAKGRHLQCDN